MQPWRGPWLGCFSIIIMNIDINIIVVVIIIETSHLFFHLDSNMQFDYSFIFSSSQKYMWVLHWTLILLSFVA